MPESSLGNSRLPLYLFGIFGIFSLLYQQIIHDVVFVQKGYRRTMKPISRYDYSCRKIADPGFEACEDMWLSEETRQLFLACSESMSRKHWMPNIGRLNATRRSLKDKVIALNIDEPEGEGFKHRVLTTSGYDGINGDGKLSLVAISGVDHGDHIDLFMNNNRPSIDPSTGEFLNNEETGANATIELFRLTRSVATDTMNHVKTFVHPQIATPNNIAPFDTGSFYFTNDHGTSKAGIWHQLSPVIRSGDVSFCSAEGECKRVDRGYAFPNGLLAGRQDGLLYVPSTMSGTITVYGTKDGKMQRVDEIHVGYPLDNLSEDANGEYWAAAIPKLDTLMSTFDDPLGDARPGATVFRVRSRRNQGRKGYEIRKMLEDADGEVLPGATTVVHDAKTERLFLSGVVSPFITICEKVPPAPITPTGL